jgi:hypothetical protein
LRSTICTGLAALITLIALAWATDLFQAFEIYLYPAQLVIAVLGLAVALAFIHLPARRRAVKVKTRWYDWLTAAIGLVTAGWMSARYPLLVDLTIDAPAEVVHGIAGDRRHVHCLRCGRAPDSRPVCRAAHDLGRGGGVPGFRRQRVARRPIADRL